MATGTPWGPSQTARRIAKGIMSYTTAGHGGIRLSPSRHAKMPEALKAFKALTTPQWIPAEPEAYWYEEDCDWAVAFLAFPAEFLAYYRSAEEYNMHLANAKQTLANTYPDVYEAFYGVELRPGESNEKDERLFFETHKGAYFTLSAWGDWHPKVPEGWVVVAAAIDRDRKNGEKYFQVPKEAYHESAAQYHMVPLALAREVDPID